MRVVITMFLTLTLGLGVAFGIALLVRLMFPPAALPVFSLLSLLWLWIGWKYAVIRDRARCSQTGLPNPAGQVHGEIGANVIPSACDFVLARREIAHVFEMVQGKAAAEGKHAYYPNAVGAAWQAYSDNPGRATAAALVSTMPPLASYFRECSPGGRFFETDQMLLRDEGGSQ